MGLSLETGWPIVGTPRPIHSPGRRWFREFPTACERWGAPSCWKHIRSRLFQGTSFKIWRYSWRTNRSYASPV